jgi:anti-sigma factor RsiW
MHPKFAGLVAYCDGNTGTLRSRWIAAHIIRCARCRAEVQRIRDEKEFLARSTGGIDMRQGLARVLSSAAAWRDDHGRAAQAELKDCVRSQIELYFGARAISVVEKPDVPAEQLLARSCEVIGAFLGTDAAAAVRDDVLLAMGSGLSQDTGG